MVRSKVSSPKPADAEDEPLPVRALKISAEIQPHLAGLGAELQSAVLADLISLWLAGHIGPTPEATEQFRAEMLTMLCDVVWDLIPASEAQVLAKIEPEGTA